MVAVMGPIEAAYHAESLARRARLGLVSLSIVSRKSLNVTPLKEVHHITATTARGIIHQVARKHGVTYADIVGPCKPEKIVRARQEAFWWVRQKLELSYPGIGRRFGGRDHSTVIHGIRKHQRFVEAQNV